MPETWTPNTLLLFLAFFVPGFICVRVYSLLVAVESADFTKQLPEVIAYSAMHYAITGWLILVAPSDATRILAAYIVVLVIPCFWPPLVLLARDWKYYRPRILTVSFSKYLLSPSATPWDRVFSASQERWIRLKLKTGTYVGGVLGRGSWTSTYPNEEQLYISERYECDATGFGGPSEGASGILVNGSEVEFIELF